MSGTDREPWLAWAVELQALAQAGLEYGHDRFDLERYEHIRAIAAEMVAYKADVSPEKVQDDKILLVRELDGKWSLPGGWVDAWLSIGENAVKEVKEEAGLDAQALSLIAVQDRDKHNWPEYAYKVCKVFVLCRALGGEFTPNTETTASGYFALDGLPPLAENKNTAEQIKMCFEAKDAARWVTRFD